MSRLRIALMQLKPYKNDTIRNIKKADEYCLKAASKDVDLILFPEMWIIGYDFTNIDFRGSGWKKYAYRSNGKIIKHFQYLANSIHTAIAITYLENNNNFPRNSVSLIDRKGCLLHTYAKVHTCDFDQESALTPGKAFKVSTLKMKHGNVRIGSMICFDREFPESARILMLKGAEIIIVPNACELEANRIGQVQSRSFENMVGIAVSNYSGPLCKGHSIAVDPFAFEKNGKSRNTIMCQADTKEGIYIADYDLDVLRKFRKSEVWGNAFRKPKTYNEIISKRVEKPFIRSH